MSCLLLALPLEIQEHFAHFIHDLPMRNAFAFGEFTTGNLDVARKLDSFHKVVEVFGVDDVRGGTSVLCYENRTMCLADFCDDG